MVVTCSIARGQFFSPLQDTTISWLHFKRLVIAVSLRDTSCVSKWHIKVKKVTFPKVYVVFSPLSSHSSLLKRHPGHGKVLPPSGDDWEFWWRENYLLRTNVKMSWMTTHVKHDMSSYRYGCIFKADFQMVILNLKYEVFKTTSHLRLTAQKLNCIILSVMIKLLFNRLLWWEDSLCAQRFRKGF